MNLFTSPSKQRNFLLFLLLVLLGIGFPFAIVTWLPFYHHGDVRTFHYWAGCFTSDFQRIYLECRPTQFSPTPNYPAPGVLFSAGALSAIKSMFQGAGVNEDWLFRVYLAAFDALNFLLLAGLASLMQLRFPIAMGLAILLIPSTWTGSALWGQIDGISLSFCLLATFCCFQTWVSTQSQLNAQTLWKSGLWLLFGLVSLSCFILVKQISIFALPFSLLLTLITVWKIWQAFQYKGLFVITLVLTLVAGCFHAIDSLLAVPERFAGSSLWFVLSTGSGHGGKISGNGFNIWMLLGRAMDSSSQIPFTSISIWNWKLDVTPYHAGILLFVGFLIFLLLTGLWAIWQMLRSQTRSNPQPQSQPYLMALLCLFFGLSQLGFNVLLSGTHERYLFLGYPFLLIAVTWFGMNQSIGSRRAIFLCFLAAFAYGCFVFSVLGAPLPEILFPLKRHEFLAAIHLFLLFVLVELWLKVCQVGSKKLLNPLTHQAITDAVHKCT